VVAFLGMCPKARPAHSTIAPARLSRFYTIGSSLEKIRFFWTRLVEHSRNGPAIAVVDRLFAVESTPEGNGESPMKWENFFSRLDLVSGRLQGFPGWPTPLEWLGLGGWALGVRIYFVASTILMMTVGMVMLGRVRVKKLYARFWAPDKTE
jgi:hypothetical protein